MSAIGVNINNYCYNFKRYIYYNEEKADIAYMVF